MTTYFGESSSDARYYPRPYSMSASAAAKTSAPAVAEASAQTSARASNTVLMAPESSPVDGLEESRVIHYSTLQAFAAAVRQLKNNLNHGRTRNQYLIVRDVDEDIMKHIEDREYKGVRYEWHGDLELLIVKAVTKAHETAAGAFARLITGTAEFGMGLPLIECQPLGAGRNTAPGGSPSKEPDWSMVNANIRPNPDDFPSIIIEVGFSESPQKLRNDARLWFSMSSNDVRIVILIAIRAANNQIIIEKWAVGPLPVGQRRSRHTPPQVPQIEQEITITRTPPNTFAITSGAAPLILEFSRLFLRPAVGAEHDIVYTQADLVDIAAAIFRMV
jgi:hypothetical protein